MSDPGNEDQPPLLPVNDATTSATDDSSVGFGNRPEEFLEDTSPHQDGPPEEPGIDEERDVEGRVDDAQRGGAGTLGLAGSAEDEEPPESQD